MLKIPSVDVGSPCRDMMSFVPLFACHHIATLWTGSHHTARCRLLFGLFYMCILSAIIWYIFTCVLSNAWCVINTFQNYANSLALSLRVILYLTRNGWRRRGMYSTAERDCKGLTNQAIKEEVIMSSYSWAGSKKILLHCIFSLNEWLKNGRGGMRIEISHRDILLTFFR